jgi:hypothetical protein
MQTMGLDPGPQGEEPYALPTGLDKFVLTVFQQNC